MTNKYIQLLPWILLGPDFKIKLSCLCLNFLALSLVSSAFKLMMVLPRETFASDLHRHLKFLRHSSPLCSLLSPN